MIVRFKRAFAAPNGLVYFEGNQARVPDAVGYAAIAVKAATPGRRVKMAHDGLTVGNRVCKAGDVVDTDLFDRADAVASGMESTIKIVATSALQLSFRRHEPFEAGDEIDVPVQDAPRIVAEGNARFKEDAVWPIA